MTAPPTTRRSTVWLVVTLGLLSAFGPLCLDMYLAALPDLPGDLRSTENAAQLTLSACMVGLGVGQLVAGPVSDRYGRRGPLLVGLALFVVTSVICAVTPSMNVLIGVRLLQGAAGAAGIVIGRAVVADLFTGIAAASYFSTIAAINGLAPIIAPALGGQILLVGSWRTVFWVLTAIGVLVLVLTLAVVRESLPAERRTSGGLRGTFRSFRILFADGGFVASVLAGTLVTAAMFGYLAASPFVLRDGFGMSAQLFSLSFAVNATGIVLLTLLGRLVLSRTTSLVLLTVGVLQTAVGAVLLLVTVLAGWGLVMVLVSLFVMVSAVGFAFPHSVAISMDRQRPIAGAASALFGLAQFGLGAVAAPLAGLGDPTSGVAMGWTAVASAFLALVALGWARRALR